LRCQLDSAVTAEEQLLIEDLGLDSLKLVALAVGFGG
jgi:acyl carrier protein